jgi:hypothetical protein
MAGTAVEQAAYLIAAGKQKENERLDITQSPLESMPLRT